MTGPCHARSDPTGQIRCAKCKTVWDRDEVMVCPGDVPLAPVVATRCAGEKLEDSNRYVSALAPDPWVAPRGSPSGRPFSGK